MTIRRPGQLLSLITLTLTLAACRGPVGPVGPGAEDHGNLAEVRTDDGSLERVVERGDDRREARTVRGIARGAVDPDRLGPALDAHSLVEVSEPATRSFTEAESPAPNDEVSRLGGQADGNEAPSKGDIRTDDPRDTGEVDGGSGGWREPPGP